MNRMLHSQTLTFNVDSPIILDDGFVALAERVLTLSQFPVFSSEFLDGTGIDSGRFYGRTPLSPMKPDFYESFDDIRQAGRYMFILLHSMPVYLRDAPPEDPEAGVAGDVLGLYSRSEDAGPCIILFPERILMEGKRDFLTLAAKVLVHELAHALMDPCNYAGLEDKFSPTYRGYVRGFMNGNTVSAAGIGRQHTFPMNFYHVREESFANVITLRLFLLASDLGIIPATDLRFVRKFMDSQPVPYNLAQAILPSSGFGMWMKAKTGSYWSAPQGHGPITQETAFGWMTAMEQCMAAGQKKRLSQFASIFSERGVLPWQKAILNDNAAPGRNHSGNSTLLNRFGDSIWDSVYDDLRSLGCSDRFAARENGKWELLEGSAGNARPSALSKAPFDEFKEGDGVLFTRNGGQWSVMDQRSGTLLRNRFADRVEFSNGYAIFQEGGLSGTLRPDGKELEPPVYNSIAPCTADVNAICRRPDGKEGMLRSGSSAVPCEYDSITDHGCFYSASKDGKKVLFKFGTNNDATFFSKNGVPVLFDSLEFHDRVIVARYGDRYGFIGERLNEICPPMFEEVGTVTANAIPVRQNGKWGLYAIRDKNVKKVHACEFVSLHYSSTFWYGTTANGKTLRIDPDFPSLNKWTKH